MEPNSQEDNSRPLTVEEQIRYLDGVLASTQTSLDSAQPLPSYRSPSYRDRVSTRYYQTLPISNTSGTLSVGGTGESIWLDLGAISSPSWSTEYNTGAVTFITKSPESTYNFFTATKIIKSE